MQERGNIWVPVNIDAAKYDPFEVKFKMTQSDKLFSEMEYRFTKEALKRKSEEQSLEFLSCFSSLKEERRSTTSDFSANTRPYPSGSCHTFISGNFSTMCSSRRLI